MRLGMMIEMVTDGWSASKPEEAVRKQARRIMTSVDAYK